MRRFFKRHIWLVIILVLAFVFPTGLSNQAKLNMRTIVTGLGIDKTDNGYTVTAQVVKTVSGTESSGIGAEIEFISDDAKTISKGLSKLLYKAGKVSAFSHTNFIILGKDVLKEDATRCLDLFLRDRLIKNSALILFAKDKASDEIKKTKNLELSVGLGLQKVFSFKQAESDGLMMTVLDFLVDNETYGKTAVASVFELQENKDNESSLSSKSSGSSKDSSSSSQGSGSSDSSSDSSNSQSGGSNSSGDSSSVQGGQESSSGSSEASGMSSDSQSSSGSDKNSKVNFKSNASLLCFKKGKFLFEISEESDLLGYMIASEKTNTSYIELENIEDESLKDVKMTVVIKDKNIHKFVRFENNIPCLDLNIYINSAEVNEVISDDLFNNFTKEQYENIKTTLKDKISKSVGDIFEKAKENGADIFSAYEQAYKFNYTNLTKYYSNEDDFIKHLRLNVKVSVKNMEN